MRWMGGLLFCVVLLSCAAPQVLWVVDSLQAPVLGEEFSQQLSYVERESGYRIKTTAYSFRENDRFVLDKELSEGTYPYVVVSPYVALELEALEVRFPGVTFLCMDAPEHFSPHPNVWGISFDPVPALKEAFHRWEQYRLSRIPNDKKLLILGKEDLPFFRELGFEESSPGVRIVLIPKGEAEETIRKNLRRELAEPVDLVVVWAGKAGSLALEMLSGMENRTPVGVLGLEVHRFPRIKDYPFVVSLQKDYLGALLQILSARSSIPTRFPYRVFLP